jgi:glycosyltransferase involved in cell wall biosynthesis
LNLSVLIPVYNRDVTLLVSSLASLLTKDKIVSEIILLDDASEPEFDILNQQLAEADFIFYSRNETNAGRTVTRKILAEQAKYNYLLFLDCDVKIVSPDFITKYHVQMKDNADVCSGGLVYDETEPDENKFKLHWRYGTFRESVQRVFLSSNFLIKKSIFTAMDFNAQLNQYGHEDTLWGIELNKKGVQARFIENPVRHEGIEEYDTYIKKSLMAAENLLVLEKMVGEQELTNHVKLYEVYKKLSKYKVTWLVALAEKWYHAEIIKNLGSYDPSLKYFDWMRLAHFIRLKNAAK